MQENQIAHAFWTFLPLTEEDMTSSSRTLRKPKNAEEEKNFIEHAVPKSTRAVTKWSVKIFLEWQNGRKNNNPAIEPWAFTTAGVPSPGAFISHTSPLRVNPFWWKVIYRNSFRARFVTPYCVITNQPISAQLSHVIYMYFFVFWRNFYNNGGKRAGKFIGVIKKQKPILKIILPWKGLAQGYSTYGGSG